MGKRSRSTGIVPLVDAVGWRGFATPPSGRICRHGGGERQVGRWEVDPAGLGDTAAAEGGDATAVAARTSGGVGCQATHWQAVGGGGCEGRDH